MWRQNTADAEDIVQDVPAERAAYILRESFDSAYRDIATSFDSKEANARQLVTRAASCQLSIGAYCQVRRSSRGKLLERRDHGMH